MGRLFVCGNWKMCVDLKDTQKILKYFKDNSLSLKLVDIVLCPPYLYIPLVSQTLSATAIKIGAQNVFWEETGAFTGEICPIELKDFAEYVICGHSERRKYFAETDEQVNKKVKASLKEGLKPIVCIGESLEDYRAANHDVVINQLQEALTDIDANQGKNIIVAYEPVWAIGSDKPADEMYANQICLRIRQFISSIYGKNQAKNTKILYGGSVNSTNSAKFVAQSEIDGLLVGGASVKPEEFYKIVDSVSKVKR
jgi:triosephosphate isomerase